MILLLACTLQAGEVWATDGPVAVTCNEISGFFVPSSLYREMRDTKEHEAYRLIVEELRLAELQIGELKSANASADRTIEQMTRATSGYEKAWRATDEALDHAMKAAERSWTESPVLWFAIGFGVAIGVVLAVAYLVPDPTVISN